MTIVQIVLDGMPWLPMQIAEFEKLNVDWNLILVHGAAANKGSTSWCKQQMPRLSRDGSSEFINGLLKNPRIKVMQRQWWSGGKDEMFRKALATITEPCVLFMPDVDELFSASQIEKIVKLFIDRPEAMRAHFFCRYYLGRKIVATSTNGFGNRSGEFLRVFRFKPGMNFERHEPPVLAGNRGVAISREETRDMGLVFEHPSYMLESAIYFKSVFYGYANLTEHWEKLQANTEWPVCDLRKFLPWVGENASADLFENVYPNERNPFENL